MSLECSVLSSIEGEDWLGDWLGDVMRLHNDICCTGEWWRLTIDGILPRAKDSVLTLDL